MTQEVIQYLPLDSIVSAPQIREQFDENLITGLAMSLRAVGQMTPIRVRRGGTGFLVIDGDRRVRAARKAGMQTVSAIVEGKELSDGEVLHRQLVANCQRVDLLPLEKTRAIKQLKEMTGWNATEIAKQLGMSTASVTRYLALDSLAEPIRAQVEAGKLPASTAYEISRIEDPAKQLELASEAADGRLTRDAASGEAKKARREQKPKESMLSRAVAMLGGGRAIAMSGAGLSLDNVIAWLEELLAKARKARAQGFELETFIKMLRDQAKA